MLPVVKRNAFQIPHGLAAIAAGICLALAFASDFHSREQNIRAELDARSTTELIAGSADGSANDPSVKSDAKQQNRSNPRGKLPSAGMLPWFPLQRDGG